MEVHRMAGPSRLALLSPSYSCMAAKSRSLVAIRASRTGLSRTSVRLASSATPQTASSPQINDKAYAKTLLLPKTAFPMRAEASKREKGFQQRTTQDLYRWQWQQKDRPLFVLHDGPPYANGNLHMGHALNKILKDIIIRYNVLRGKRVNYKAGWDCHGLPIEHKALQQLAKDHRELNPLEIRKVAKKTAEKAIQVQRKEFKEFAIMTDWDQVYKTFDREYEIRQLRVFQEMVNKDLIYRAAKPVMWSPTSKTALAEAEVSYKDDHVSESVFAKFPLVEQGPAIAEAVGGLDGSDKISLIVWTTTPWTLPANMFVAYNPDIDYAIVSPAGRNELYIIAASRIEHLNKVTGEDLQIRARIPGHQLRSTTYRAPFQSAATGKPLIPGSHVTDDSGTGLVHSAPAHGAEDYVCYRDTVAKSLSREEAGKIICPIDADGLFTADTTGQVNTPALDRLRGKSVLGDASKEVIAMLKEADLLVAKSKIRHKYPYDWKTKQPVIFRLTSQWFANLDKIKETAVGSLQKVNFVPQQGVNRLESFVRGRSEWCISRQRAWGVPIPVIYEADTGEAVTDNAVIDKIISVLSEKGIHHWWTGAVEDFLTPTLQKSGKAYLKGQDTMDVWLDSGVSWTGLKEDLDAEGYKRDVLADVYLEGSDQHRGWFQSSLLTSIALTGEAPFKNVITHGFVLDEKGVKMSKSDGNVISPLTIINGGKDLAKEPAYGADVLRFWAGSANYTKEVAVSTGILANAAEGLRKIRNSIRFILGNLSGTQTLVDVPPQLSIIDQYVLHEVAVLSQIAEKAYDEFTFNRAIVALNNFCNVTLSSFYFEIIKDSLYADAQQAPRRQAVVYTLQQMLPIMTSILAPVVPHLAEDVWQHWPGAAKDTADSFFRRGWQAANPAWLNAGLAEDVGALKTVKSEVANLLEQARTDKLLGNSVEASVDIVIHNGQSKTSSLCHQHADILSTLFVVSSVRLLRPSDHQQSYRWMKSQEVKGEDGRSIMTLYLHPTNSQKCPRCWLFTRKATDATCARCTDVLGHA